MANSFLTILALSTLALGASSIALSGNPYCVPFIVSNYASYNLANYGLKKTFTATTNVGADPSSITFNYCQGLTKNCANNGDVYARFSQTGLTDCADLATSVQSSGPAVANYPDKGVNITFDPVGSNQLIMTFSCDASKDQDTDLNVWTYNSSKIKNAKGNTINLFWVVNKSKQACPVYTLGELERFMSAHKAIFVAIFVVLGIFFAFFGLKAINVTIFSMAAVAVFFLTASICYQLVDFQSKPWLPWALLITCIALGCVAGYFAVKLEKVGFFAIGVLLGAVGFLFLYGSIISGFKTLSKTVLYVVEAVCGIIGGCLALYLYKDIIIIATSFVGSYLSIRAIAVYVKHFPNEEEMLAGTATWNAWAIGYAVVIGLMTAGGIFVQFKNKKDEEDEEAEGKAENVNSNMPTSDAYEMN